MAGRWQCSRQREVELLVEEMAREMYLRDWKLKMQMVHLVMLVKLLRKSLKLKTI